MIGTSIIFLPEWKELEPHLHVVDCAQDGGTIDDPRIRIEFLGLTEAQVRRLINVKMPCVHCCAENFPLRRRETDTFDQGRIYYAPACPIQRRIACSRGRAAELEYERFKGISIRGPLQTAQLSLF